MEKRYYYRDPLVVGWMMLHHELRIGLLESGSGQFIDLQYPAPARWGKQFYIHSDSIHLLKPIIGDEVYFPSGDYHRVEEVKAAIDSSNKEYLANGGEILRRNGKQFFAPECEQP